MALLLPSLSFPPAAVVRVTGPDSLPFLQGQFTQDLRPVSPGGAAYGLWLNQKGKVIGDSHVLKQGADEWWLVSEFTPASVLLPRLETYLIADDVTLEDVTSQWHLALGADAAEPFSWRSAATLPVGLRLLPRGEARADASADERLRYVAARRLTGLPSIPLDFGEGDLPQEAGLEGYAVSFNKGCYLGQEVMARLHAMGQVRRQWLGVYWRGESESVVPVPKTEIVDADGKRVGEWRGGAVVDGSCVGAAMVLRAALALKQAGGPAVLWRCGAGRVELP